MPSAKAMPTPYRSAFLTRPLGSTPQSTASAPCNDKPRRFNMVYAIVGTCSVARHLCVAVAAADAHGSLVGFKPPCPTGARRSGHAPVKSHGGRDRGYFSAAAAMSRRRPLRRLGVYV